MLISFFKKYVAIGLQIEFIVFWRFFILWPFGEPG